MLKKLLVTGGLGVVGSRFVELMASGGCHVTVIDSAEEVRNDWMAAHLRQKFGLSVTIIVDRLEEIGMSHMADLIGGSDAVLHAAAHTGIPHSEADPDDDWSSNVEATRSMLEAMRSHGLRVPTVMLSSVKPYRTSGIPSVPGDGRTCWDPGFHGVNEDVPLEPDEPYAASKMAQSALAMAYARSYGLPVTVLRCSNLYGDAPCHGPRHGWLTWFCIAAAMDWGVELQGDGCQTRDMLFSDDVASAVLASFSNIGSLMGGAFNIGGGASNTVSCSEALRILGYFLGRPVKVRRGPGRKNEDMLFFTDHERFSRLTGWSPRVGVLDGMARIVRWAAENRGDLASIYSVS